jgi:hypothetical protein
MRIKRPPKTQHAFCCKEQSEIKPFYRVGFILDLWLRKSWPQDCTFLHLTLKLSSARG